MAKNGTQTVVVGEIGKIDDLRDQLSKLAKSKGTSLPEVAEEKLGVSKQRLYALLASGKIYESQLSEILNAMNATPAELHLSA